jgi:hypothetical protein
MTCYHEVIRHYRFEDGTPAPLWSCWLCGVKFVPATEPLEAERKLAALTDSNTAPTTGTDTK